MKQPRNPHVLIALTAAKVKNHFFKEILQRSLETNESFHFLLVKENAEHLIFINRCPKTQTPMSTNCRQWPPSASLAKVLKQQEH